MDLFLEAQLNRHNLELTWVSVIEAQPKPISRYALDSLKHSWAQLLSPKPEIKLEAQRGSGNVSNPNPFRNPTKLRPDHDQYDLLIRYKSANSPVHLGTKDGNSLDLYYWPERKKAKWPKPEVTLGLPDLPYTRSLGYPTILPQNIVEGAMIQRVDHWVNIRTCFHRQQLLPAIENFTEHQQRPPPCRNLLCSPFLVRVSKENWLESSFASILNLKSNKYIIKIKKLKRKKPHSFFETQCSLEIDKMKTKEKKRRTNMLTEEIIKGN